MKTYQFTNKGMTISELFKRGRPGDKLTLVSDYTFGMPHAKFKIARLTETTYILKNIKDKYAKDSIYMLIESETGVPYSVIGTPDYITGLSL